jgi:hypothetical protein
VISSITLKYACSHGHHIVPVPDVVVGAGSAFCAAGHMHVLDGSIAVCETNNHRSGIRR